MLWEFKKKQLRHIELWSQAPTSQCEIHSATQQAAGVPGRLGLARAMCWRKGSKPWRRWVEIGPKLGRFPSTEKPARFRGPKLFDAGSWAGW